MDFTNITNLEFSKQLSSGAPTPGGGSVAALMGSFGAALTSMVCMLTVGKEKYKEYEELMQNILRESENLRCKLLDEVNNDTNAFNIVSDVYKMPKDTPQQKEERAQKLQIALKKATLAPYSVITLCVNALEVCASAVSKSNSNAASDLGVAAVSLKAAVYSAYLNILINLGSINDIDFVSKYLLRAQELVTRSSELADSIYNTVASKLADSIQASYTR